MTVPLLVYLSPRVKNPRVIQGLAVLGGITYPLYLLHQKIGNAMINFMAAHFNISWNPLAIGFEVLIICVAYAVYLQDKKMRTWLKKKLFTDSVDRTKL